MVRLDDSAVAGHRRVGPRRAHDPEIVRLVLGVLAACLAVATLVLWRSLG